MAIKEKLCFGIFLFNCIRLSLFSYLHHNLQFQNSQFTVIIIFCALDTTLRILNTLYKLHVMKLYIRGPLQYHINTCPKRDLNLGPMAFSLLQFEIAPKTTQPPRLDSLETFIGEILVVAGCKIECLTIFWVASRQSL